MSYYFKNGIGLQPLQQPGERIMRRGEGGPGLHAFGLRAVTRPWEAIRKLTYDSLVQLGAFITESYAR